MSSITSIKCVLTQEHLDAVCSKYFVPEEIHPQLPGPDDTMHERLTGKVGMYTRFFDYANYRIPFSNFFVYVLTHFRISFSQLSVFGSAKVSQFEILCRVCNIEPSVGLFRYFYMHNYKNGWFGFTKLPNVRACYTKNLNSVKNWNDHFFWMDEFMVPASARFEMNLNAFIRTADPHKVRIVERARTENERPIVTVAKHRTVTLLPTSVPRPSEELSDSVEREFGEYVSGSGGGGQENASVGSHGNVEPIMPVADDVVAETGSSRIKRSKKKRVICKSEDTPVASHPPKKLRADYGKTSGSATGASPLEEGGDHTNSATCPALRTIGPSERFVVLSDSSHHSSAKSADAEVDSLIRSVAPVMTVATTLTTFVSAVATTTVTPADTDRTFSLFTDRSGSDFVVGDIRAEGAADTGLQEIYVPGWSVTRGFELNDRQSCADMIDHFTPPTFFKAVSGMEHEQLFAEFNFSAARNLSLSSEVRMRAEYNILEKRKWKSLAEERNNLLQVKDKEIERLGSQLLRAKDESEEVARLRARVSSLEAIESSLRGEVASAKEHISLLEQERNALNLKATSLESTVAEKDRELSDLETSSSSLRVQNQSLVNQVHELEVSSAGLREKLETFLYGGSWECFWACYRERDTRGLAAGIEHGQDGRCLNDLEAYNPSTEADFNSAVQNLRGLDFPLLQELSAKKDASIWDVMNLLRLDDVVAEVLGMTNLQPDVSQLMVPVYRNQDQAVIGRQVLSVALDICHGRVQKMERNLIERLPFLKDVFVSIDHPLSAEALTILPETPTEPPVTALTTTALSAVVVHPSFDPSLSVEDYENPDLVGAVPKDVIPEPGSEGNVGGSTRGDANVGDFVFSELENEARNAAL
ncbi:hypothetical protein Tco_1428216 [Tanacetum coccineum]